MYLLVKIEDVVIACLERQRRVRDILMLESEEQLRRTLHLKLHTSGTEDLIGRTDIELHIRDVKFLLVVMLHFAHFLLPVLVHDLPLGIVVVLLLGEHVRRGDIGVADACMEHVYTCLGLVFDGRGDIVRILQVD